VTNQNIPKYMIIFLKIIIKRIVKYDTKNQLHQQLKSGCNKREGRRVGIPKA
jgi:hypothetical protein